MVTGEVAMIHGPEDEWWERAVIGAILQGYNDLPALKRIIDRHDFDSVFGGGLWETIVRLDADGETPTVAMLVQRLGAHVHRLPGGPVYLSDLASSVEILPFQAESYAHELRKCSLRRQAGKMGLRLIQQVQDPGSDPEVLLARNQDWLDKIRERRQLGAGYEKSALEQVIDTAENGEKAAFTTPWSDLDSILGGWHPGACTIVGARPGVGKSLFAENAVTDVVRRHDCHAVLISLEMTEKEIAQRTMAHTAKVLLSSLRAGRHHLTEQDWERIQRAIPQMEADRERLTVVEGAGFTLLDIKATVVQAQRRATKAGVPLALVAVDYIQRIRSHDHRQSRQQQLGEVIDGIKDLALQYGFHGLVPAQLNRGSESRHDKRPQLSDFRESGDLEQTGDNAILLHEEEEEINGKPVKSGMVDLIVAKQRNGPTGVRTLVKFGEYANLAQTLPPSPPPLRAVKD